MPKKKRHVSPKDGCVWITGASTGIGRDLAIRLAKDGWSVAATARSIEGLTTLKEESGTLKGNVEIYQGDISEQNRMAEIIRTIEAKQAPIAMAILNAGIYLPVEMAELDLDRFEKSIDVNLKGTAFCLSPLIPLMKERGFGHIAIVSSVTGYGGLPTSGAYGATKAALNNMAECMEIELAKFGIRTTIINPGFVDTPAQDDLTFPKPFMISSEAAAKRIVAGLKRNKFEITFPRRFTYILKCLNNFLPKDLYLTLIRKLTGRTS